MRKRQVDELNSNEARFQGYEEVKPYIVDDEEDFFPTRNIQIDDTDYACATITKSNIRSRSPMALPRPSQSRLHEERERGRSISPSR